MLATMPLGLANMGIVIPVNNDHVVALLSFIGTVLAVGVAVPYIFYHDTSGSVPVNTPSTSGKPSNFTNSRSDQRRQRPLVFRHRLARQ